MSAIIFDQETRTFSVVEDRDFALTADGKGVSISEIKDKWVKAGKKGSFKDFYQSHLAKTNEKIVKDSAAKAAYRSAVKGNPDVAKKIGKLSKANASMADKLGRIAKRDANFKKGAGIAAGVAAAGGAAYGIKKLMDRRKAKKEAAARNA